MGPRMSGDLLKGETPKAYEVEFALGCVWIGSGHRFMWALSQFAMPKPHAPEFWWRPFPSP